MTTQAMSPWRASTPNWWLDLQDDSDLSSVQELIRGAIRQGTIRVLPGSGSRIRIVPIPASPRPRGGNWSGGSSA